jgi:zinc finger protein 830
MCNPYQLSFLCPGDHWLVHSLGRRCSQTAIHIYISLLSIMTDVRALLKAKRQEARITHPLASYNQAGQLRCVTCGTLVKHASAWEGHLGSKAHRTNVARLKEEKAREEQRLREQEQVERGKRKAEDESPDSSDETDDGEIQTKRRRTDTGKPRAKSTEFPTDFFSDPYRAQLPPQSDEEEEEEEPADYASKPPPLATPPSAVDLEYERFQRELLNGPDFQETYERATVIAEPDLVPESTEGLPVQEGDGAQESKLAQKQSEEVTRKQKEQDERELIMDRLLEEERAQEEADMKVTVMKTRLEALKKRRQAKALKTQIDP